MENGKNNIAEIVETRIGKSKTDNLIELIKMLHCEPDTELFYTSDRVQRENMAFGVTKQDAAERFGVDERTIFNMISQLDPDRRPINEEPYYVAGQPINLKIVEKRISNTKMQRYDTTFEVDRRARFCSESSMHPVFLQLNVTQLGALLRALAVDYKEYDSQVTLGLAAYIYAQMSSYSKDRIIKIYAEQDEDISELLEALENMDESDMDLAFRTESELSFLNQNGSDRDTLTMYVKNEWECNVKIKNNGHVIELHNAHICYENNFKIITNDGRKISIVPEEISSITKCDCQ